MAEMASLPAWICGALLLTLRIGPALAFAPPFSLVRFPALFRVLLALGLSASIVSFRPDALAGLELAPGALLISAARELMLGIVVVTVFQRALECRR